MNGTAGGHESAQTPPILSARQRRGGLPCGFDTDA